jgi:hypothetical protein
LNEIKAMMVRIETLGRMFIEHSSIEKEVSVLHKIIPQMGCNNNDTGL